MEVVILSQETEHSKVAYARAPAVALRSFSFSRRTFSDGGPRFDARVLAALRRRCRRHRPCRPTRVQLDISRAGCSRIGHWRGYHILDRRKNRRSRIEKTSVRAAARSRVESRTQTRRDCNRCTGNHPSAVPVHGPGSRIGRTGGKPHQISQCVGGYPVVAIWARSSGCGPLRAIGASMAELGRG